MSSMRHARAENRSRAMLALTTGLVLVLIGAFVSSQSVSAALYEKNVRGYVRDVEGNLIQGIPVTINILWAGTENLRSTLAAVSDEDGFFQVTFGPSFWDIGDTIEVIATHNGNQVRESAIAADIPTQQIDITFPYEIPEFGSAIGLIIAGGLVAVVATVLLVSKKRR